MQDLSLGRVQEFLAIRFGADSASVTQLTHLPSGETLAFRLASGAGSSRRTTVPACPGVHDTSGTVVRFDAGRAWR